VELGTWCWPSALLIQKRPLTECERSSMNRAALRHACGYALANAGHDTRALQAYLDHKNIQHTVRYTELAPHRFKDFWR
jgi:type 1 fimbriae regulatory protein FimB/type 1 fimbriae regulatory protein FimE